ncbi:MAG: calcium/sodium antiporter [Candidatus Omnitrophota bacterium]
MNLVLFIIGIIVLYLGGEYFIKGSSSVAFIFKIRPLIIGVVIVAFATSCPELFVSLLAVLRKSRSLAIGNIVGSCICNIGLVLGLSALIRPISVKVSVLKRELPILFIATAAFFLVCIDLYISRIDAGMLFALFLIFVFLFLRSAKAEASDLVYFERIKGYTRVKSFLYMAIGLIGLILGAQLVVVSAIRIALLLNINEFVIGLSAVAIGTSLPELAASMVASARGESEISFGNIVGSNMFNMLAIVGFVCLLQPVAVDKIIVYYSIPLLILYTFALLPILKKGLMIGRVEGFFLIASYFVYLYLMF